MENNENKIKVYELKIKKMKKHIENRLKDSCDYDKTQAYKLNIELYFKWVDKITQLMRPI